MYVELKSPKHQCVRNIKIVLKILPVPYFFFFFSLKVFVKIFRVLWGHHSTRENNSAASISLSMGHRNSTVKMKR